MPKTLRRLSWEALGKQLLREKVLLLLGSTQWPINTTTSVPEILGGFTLHGGCRDTAQKRAIRARRVSFSWYCLEDHMGAIPLTLSLLCLFSQS